MGVFLSFFFLLFLRKCTHPQNAVSWREIYLYKFSWRSNSHILLLTHITAIVQYIKSFFFQKLRERNKEDLRSFMLIKHARWAKKKFKDQWIYEWTYLTNKHISLIKVSSEHFGWISWNWFDFYTNFLSFSRRFDLLVIVFNGRHNAQFDKLQKNWEKKFIEKLADVPFRQQKCIGIVKVTQFFQICVFLVKKTVQNRISALNASSGSRMNFRCHEEL